MNAIDRFNTLAADPKFAGWPIVGEPELGAKLPFFGQALNYKLQTGRGVEDYTSIIRHFGWVVVFGVTRDEDITVEKEVITLVQWKPGVNRASWELPPGGIGKVPPGMTADELLTATQASYLKETGYGGGRWHYLGSTDVESGKFRGAGPDDHGLPAHMFLAEGLDWKANRRSPEANEIMETLMVPLREFRSVIDSGQFREVSAQLCAMHALRRLGIS